MAVQLDDHVAAADARLVGRAPRLDAIDERALGVGEILGPLKLTGDVLDADAEIPPLDLGFLAVVVLTGPGFLANPRIRSVTVVVPVVVPVVVLVDPDFLLLLRC